MFSVPRNKGQGRSEKYDHSYDDMNPSAMGICSENGRNKRKEGHQKTVNNASRRKSYSQSIPNFFHRADIPEIAHLVYNGVNNMYESKGDK